MLGERVLVYVATLQTFKASPLASPNPAVQRADSSFISASSPWFPSLDCLVLDHPPAQSFPWTGTLRPGRGSDAASSRGPWCCRGRGGWGTTGQGRILPSLAWGSELDRKAPGQAPGHPGWHRDLVWGRRWGRWLGREDLGTGHQRASGHFLAPESLTQSHN